MSKCNDLLFLRLLVGKLVDRSIEIEIGVQKFRVSAKPDYLIVMQKENHKQIETDDRRLLTNFFVENTTYLLAATEDQLYGQIVQEIMKAMMNRNVGLSRTEMEVTIGCLAESHPEEVERYLRLLKGI